LKVKNQELEGELSKLKEEYQISENKNKDLLGKLTTLQE